MDIKRGSNSFPYSVIEYSTFGGIGLFLPYALGISLILTPIAAIGLGIIMILAVVFHAKRKENQAIGMNIILLALVIFVAIGRW